MTPEALRAHLADDLRTGAARWIRLSGLSLSSANDHRALCHTLAVCGLHEESETRVPSTVVLDWRSMERVNAEAVAFFVVVVRSLASRGTNIRICCSDRSDVDDVVGQAIGETDKQLVSWHGSAAACIASVRSLVPSVAFAPTNSALAGPFCSQLSDSLKTRMSADGRRIVMGTVLEALQNGIEHSGATHIAMTAFLHSRKRPPVIELGFADDGRGIPTTLSQSQAHRWVDSSHDASVAERVVGRAMTSRADGGEATAPQGGLGQILQRLLDGTRCEIYLRSGAGLLTATSEQPSVWTKSYMDHGFGTQLRIAIKVEEREPTR